MRSDLFKFGFKLEERDFVDFVNFNSMVLKRLRDTYNVFDSRVKFLDSENKYMEEYRSRKVAYLGKVLSSTE